MAGQEAGWYPDPEPESGARLRYWDGENWTAHTREMDAGSVPVQPGQQDSKSAGHDEAPKRLGGRARIASIALALVIPIEIWVILADLDYIGVVNRTLDGERIALSEYDSAEQATTSSSIAQTAVYVIAAITFLFWFARAFYNLPRLGVGPLRFGRGWSIGGWFVPILNLFRPKAIANDIWRGSDAAAKKEAFSDWKAQPVPAVVHWWWAMYIIGELLSRAVARVFIDQDETFATRQEAIDLLRDERTGFSLDVAASIVSIIAALLAIQVIRKLTKRQEEAGVPE